MTYRSPEDSRRGGLEVDDGPATAVPHAGRGGEPVSAPSSDRREAGFILAQAALLLVPMLIVAAFATDIGAWYLEGQKVQRGVDAAALAAVTLLPDVAAAEAEARATAARNGYVDATPGDNTDFETLWRRSLPESWWPAVVPGTMFPTMGGCVAMNIHGKNCYKAGPFGDHVLELDLMTADGQVRTLSPDREGDLFRAVIAGLGLLGVVTRVKLQLKRVHSGRLRVRPIRTPTLDAMFDALAARTASADYLVGWIDCFASGEALGRGIVHEAHHLHEGEDPKGAYTLAVEHQDLPHAIFGVPRTLVWRFLQPFTNDAGLRLINQVKYLLPETTERDGTFFDSHASFSFLLDYVPDWRRAYGPSGFIQYQIFVPDGTAREAMREALALCLRRGIVSYLGVFKRHRPDSYLLSHGLDGWSLALDFPVPRREPERLWALTRDLTRIVLEAGGTFYPAKDQVVDAKSFAQAFGDRYTKFRTLKRAIDPDGLFAGDQARRLELI